MVSWSVWAGGLSLVMGIVTREQLISGFAADNTGMSVVIAAVFAAGLVISFLAARQLHSEWIVLKRIEQTGSIPGSRKETDLASVFNALASHKNKMEVVDIHAAIDTYHAKHNSRVRSVSIIAALVISMGLLGTVVGLIMSISGLGGMVENIGLSRTTMMETLKTTVAGMGTAFYTTFFGALGGLILRAVAVSQLNSLSELCAEATEYADAHLTTRFENKEEELNQKVSQVIAGFDNMQKEITAITARLTESFEATMRGFGTALAEAGNHAMVATKDCIADMTEQVASEVGKKISSSLAVFNKSMELSGKDVRKTFRTINTSIGRYGDKMNMAFDGLSNTVQQSGGNTADSFSAFNATVKEGGDAVAHSLADFKMQIDSTCTELQEAMDALQSTIHRSTHEMNSLSKARLDVEATEIAGQLSLAASSIQQLLSKKNTSEENQKVA
jgi:hypothetical protein